MSKFVQEVKLDALKFQDDIVECTVKPIKRSLYLKVLPAIQDINTAKNDLTEKLGREPSKEELGRDPRVLKAMQETLDVVAPFIKEHVISFKGPKDQAGVEVPLDTVLDTAYFTEAALYLVMGLVSTSTVDKEVAGKSEGLSGA